MQCTVDPTRAKGIIIEAAATETAFLDLATAPTGDEFEALSVLVGSNDPAPEIVTDRLHLCQGASWTEVAKSILIGPALWRISASSERGSADGNDGKENGHVAVDPHELRRLEPGLKGLGGSSDRRRGDVGLGIAVGLGTEA